MTDGHSPQHETLMHRLAAAAGRLHNQLSWRARGDRLSPVARAAIAEIVYTQKVLDLIDALPDAAILRRD